VPAPAVAFGADQIAEMEEIVTHELVHVYDVRKLQLDLRDCESLAYSEVRAARFAECSRTWYPYARTCARYKALSATANLYPIGASACVRRVFDAAMRDARPFGAADADPDPRSSANGASGR
jgi:hypothetical protein